MKGMSEITSIRDTRSLHSVGGGCIPKHQRSANLELYVLSSEKSRLEKEVFALDKRRNTARKQLDGVSKRIEKLQEETQWLNWSVSPENAIRTDQPVEIPKSVFDTKNYHIVRPTEIDKEVFDGLFALGVGLDGRGAIGGELVNVRTELEIRGHRRVPGNDLAGMNRRPPHDVRQVGQRRAAGLVMRPVVLDGIQ